MRYLILTFIAVVSCSCAYLGAGGGVPEPGATIGEGAAAQSAVAK